MECSHSQLLRDSNNFFFILTVLRYQPIQDSSNRPFQSAQELTSQALQKQGEESPKLGFSEIIRAISMYLYDLANGLPQVELCVNANDFYQKGELSTGLGIHIYMYQGICGSCILTLPKHSIFTALLFPVVHFLKCWNYPHYPQTFSTDILFIYLCIYLLASEKNEKM